jgi:hypothetical protein
MQWMRFFVMLLAGISAMFLLLQRVGIDFTGVLPVRQVAISDNPLLQSLQALLLVAAYIGVFMAALRQRDIRVIIFTWLIILLFNAGDILVNAYRYFTWVKPVAKVYSTRLTPASIIMEHVAGNRRERFLSAMIYPSCWMLISIFSLAKTVKEKIRMYLAAADKGQA